MPWQAWVWPLAYWLAGWLGWLASWLGRCLWLPGGAARWHLALAHRGGLRRLDAQGETTLHIRGGIREPVQDILHKGQKIQPLGLRLGFGRVHLGPATGRLGKMLGVTGVRKVL